MAFGLIGSFLFIIIQVILLVDLAHRIAAFLYVFHSASIQIQSCKVQVKNKPGQMNINLYALMSVVMIHDHDVYV